jgi:hypothetical protein
MIFQAEEARWLDHCEAQLTSATPAAGARSSHIGRCSSPASADCAASASARSSRTARAITGSSDFVVPCWNLAAAGFGPPLGARRRGGTRGRLPLVRRAE